MCTQVKRPGLFFSVVYSLRESLDEVIPCSFIVYGSYTFLIKISFSTAEATELVDENFFLYHIKQ